MTLEDAKELLARLAPWLARALARERPGARAVRLESPEVPANGRSSTTILFNACWTEDSGPQRDDFVLRVQPQGNQIFMHPDVLRDARVMRGLAGGPVPVPRILWSEDNRSVLGDRFFIMSRIAGRPVQGRPSNQVSGWLPAATPHLRSRLYRNGIAAMARVHDVDWRAGHVFLHSDGLGVDLGAHLERMTRWYRWAANGRRHPVTDATLDYLHTHARAVDPGPTCLLWGDARMGNLMFTEDGTVSAVLDWEVASIGPANIDVGYWLMNEDFNSTANGIARLEGVPGNEAQLAHYEACAGRRLPDIRYFEIMGALMMATTLIRQADIRVADGRLAQDNSMASGNTFTQMLARHLGMPVPELSPQWLAHRKPAREAL